MSLLSSFQLMLKQKHGFASQNTFLLAVSGGIDSVVLCDLFSKCGIRFLVAHCNFQLRAEESLRDEEFVKALATSYQVELFIQRFDTAAYAASNKLSTQVAARDLRYNWFRKIAFEEGKADYIVTAHHADDNIETVVMNFFRGTGVKGLAGMDEHFQKIWRPLLQVRKQELLDYAQQVQLKYVEDSSNATSNYTRNYFRNELLPAIAEVFPSVTDNILKNIQRFGEVEQVYQQAIAQHKSKLLEVHGNEVHIPILKLKKSEPLRTILWEIISERNFSAAQVDEIIKLMDAENGSFIRSGTHRIIKNRKWFIISPLQLEEENKFVVIEHTDKRVHFNIGSLLLEHNVFPLHAGIVPAKEVAMIDASEVTFPLLLRKWKQGDFFYPLGMKKKKKLNRFFIDQKLSPTEKEKVWVLESNKRIMWVVGLRLDDRFKITGSTKNILKVTLE